MKIYKYHAININLLHSLRNKTNWYSKLPYLNDPYECFFLDHTQTDVYKDFLATLCVCCFSKNMDNILMWSHYADSHRGVCLEWTVGAEDESVKTRLRDVTYENVPVVLDEVKRTKNGHLDINITTNGKFLFQKFNYWGYEEEIRSYIFCEDPYLKGKSEKFIGELTSIYFGKNAVQDDIDLIKFNTTHIRNLKYYKVELDTVSLEYKRLVKV